MLFELLLTLTRVWPRIGCPWLLEGSYEVHVEEHRPRGFVTPCRMGVATPLLPRPFLLFSGARGLFRQTVTAPLPAPLLKTSTEASSSSSRRGCRYRRRRVTAEGSAEAKPLKADAPFASPEVLAVDS